MDNDKLTEEEIMEVFEKLQILTDTSKKVGVWQVHPIDKGTKLFTETH